MERSHKENQKAKESSHLSLWEQHYKSAERHDKHHYNPKSLGVGGERRSTSLPNELNLFLLNSPCNHVHSRPSLGGGRDPGYLTGRPHCLILRNCMTVTVMSHTGAYRGLSPSSGLLFTQSSPMTLALWGLSVDNSSGNAKAGWKTLGDGAG